MPEYPGSRPSCPYRVPMPTMATDVQDHFTEVFGTKRGADRPDDDVLAITEDEALVPSAIADVAGFCPGGCGCTLTARRLLLGQVTPTFQCQHCYILTNVAGDKQEEQGSPVSPGQVKRELSRSRRSERRSAEEKLRRQEKRDEKRRFLRCFFSWPLGHAYPQGVRRSVRMSLCGGDANVCAACGKFRYQTSGLPAHAQSDGRYSLSYR